LADEIPPDTEPGKKPIQILDLMLVGLMPTLVGKILILYFGHKYSAHPGEGYGWWLIGTVMFTAATVSRFLWKYRNWTE
jgi:hypothetical protein